MPNKKTYPATFDKSLIATLPPYSFAGRIEVVQSVAEAERAVAYLQKFDCLGIDTETRPAFKRGVSHKVALLQISTSEICFLFRLNMIGLPECLINLLENENIIKIGLSLHDDLSALRSRSSELKAGAWIDLQKMVKQIGIADLSLQKLFANIFGLHISKGARLSNWEADVLSDAQKRYAATDAEACLRLYDKFREMLDQKNYIILKNSEATS